MAANFKMDGLTRLEQPVDSIDIKFWHVLDIFIAWHDLRNRELAREILAGILFAVEHQGDVVFVRRGRSESTLEEVVCGCALFVDLLLNDTALVWPQAEQAIVALRRGEGACVVYPDYALLSMVCPAQKRNVAYEMLGRSTTNFLLRRHPSGHFLCGG